MSDELAIHWIVLGHTSDAEPLWFDAVALMDTSGGLARPLPQVGDRLRIGQTLPEHVVKDRLWEYRDGITMPPTDVTITLRAVLIGG